MWGAQTLSNLAGIVSGPVALLGSRDGRTSRTSVGEREREGERGGGRGGERERDITYCPNQRVLSVESMQVRGCRLETHSELVHRGLNTE